MENEKILALAEFLNVDEADIADIREGYDSNIFEYYGEEYEVLTDEEADDRWEEELNYYIEECIIPELPENMQNYFDEEAWKRDARLDGRGHAISRYDGNENEAKINDTYYYIYRQN